MNQTKPSNSKMQSEDTKTTELSQAQFEKLAGMNGTPLSDKTISKFPVDVFPPPVQDIILALNETLKYPVDYTGASFLGAASVAIGNTYKVEFKKGFVQNAVLYMAIVGKPGTSKTHPLSFAMKPLKKRDNLKYSQYKPLYAEYLRISKMSESKRKAEGVELPEKPVWEQIIVQDFTPEALAIVHKTNLRGIVVHCDELASWYKNFTRYNNSSAEQTFLSIWSGEPISITRVTTEPTYIPNPFVTVLGTIQPGILNEMAKDRTQNGFIDRILFAFPDDVRKTYWSDIELEQVFINNWYTILENLLNIPVKFDEADQVKPTVLKYTPEAKALYFEWQRRMTDKSNESENDIIKGIYAKMDLYCIRFSLILEMLRYACDEDAGNAISIESVKGAIKLAQYFTTNAVKVHEILNANPFDRLTNDKQKVYEALPEEFKTQDGVKIAVELGMPERTFKQFIVNQELFIKPKHGLTQKRY